MQPRRHAMQPLRHAMQGFRPRRHAMQPVVAETRPCTVRQRSPRHAGVQAIYGERARPCTTRLCPWIVRACREIDGWIASVTKAAKIFCVRGCLRTGVQLCALSRRACVSEEGWFPPLRVLVDARLSTRARLARLSAAAAPGPLATLCETPLRPCRRPALVRLELSYRVASRRGKVCG